MRKAFRIVVVITTFNLKKRINAKENILTMVVKEMSEELTEIQLEILSLILTETRRPSAIASILRRRYSTCNQNLVVQSLIDLEKRGLVERTTSKAWIAKGKAVDYVD